LAPGPLRPGPTAPAPRPLLAALADGAAAVRAAAASALARGAAKGLRGRAVYLAVMPLLRDRDPRVQAAALRAAALLDGRAALPEIAAVAARSHEAQVVEAASAATGDARGPPALAAR